MKATVWRRILSQLETHTFFYDETCGFTGSDIEFFYRTYLSFKVFIFGHFGCFWTYFTCKIFVYYDGQFKRKILVKYQKDYWYCLN